MARSTHAARVEAVLKSVGGGVSVNELVYQTGFSHSEVADALCELEAGGRATPWAWTLGSGVTR